MANVSYLSASWVSMEGGDMAPGDDHAWTAAPIEYGAAYSVTAQPVTGDPSEPHRTLIVNSVRVSGEPDGVETLLFSVKNVGSSFIVGYGVFIGIISQ